jgi:vacuolar protein-sorting-associated protein 4
MKKIPEGISGDENIDDEDIPDFKPIEEKSKTTWDDVVGLESAKQTLNEAVYMPMKFPQLFTGQRKPWRAILLYGPPGTGKSLLAKAVANEIDASFFAISSSDIMSKWQGTSEKQVRKLFEDATKASPTIIFIDDIYSICGTRSDNEQESSRRVNTELLMRMQGINENENVFVLAATNTPWSLDSAFRRRFERRVYIPLPNKNARRTLIKNFISSVHNNITDNNIREIAEKTDNYSGADIAILCRNALMQPIRKCQNAKQFVLIDNKYVPCEEYPNCSKCPMNLSDSPNKDKVCEFCGAICISIFDVEPEMLTTPILSMPDLEKALIDTKSSVDESELNRYTDWTLKFGQEGV